VDVADSGRGIDGARRCHRTGVIARSVIARSVEEGLVPAKRPALG
jgi:hypothetical protein